MTVTITTRAKRDLRLLAESLTRFTLIAMADSLAELAETWLIWRNSVRPSPATLRARRADLVVIGGLIAAGLGKPVVAVGSDEIQRWLGPLSPADLTADVVTAAFGTYSENHAQSSLRRCRATWAAFCAWLVSDREVLEANPIEMIALPRGKRWAPRPLPEEELVRIVQAAQSPSSRAHRPWPELEQVLCGLFVGAGLRVAEVINARREDVLVTSRGHSVVSVTGKGGVIRVVPLPPGVATTVDRYFVSRAQRLGPVGGGDRLVVRTQGGPLTPKVVDNLVRGWFRRADVKPLSGALAHSLRHSYAVYLVDESRQIPELERLLGRGDVAAAYLEVASAMEQAPVGSQAPAPGP